MDLAPFLNKLGEWLQGKGPDSDIVISSRIRLARNVRDYFFVNRMSYEEKQELWELVSSKVREWEQEEGGEFSLVYFNLEEASRVDCDFLVERHLISQDLARSTGPRGVILDPAERIGIMVNEEDHLRIQVIRSGFQIDTLWEEICEIDDELERRLPFAFHSEFGYLTACPSNVGTGLRVSVMLHLPGLVMTKRIQKVFLAIQNVVNMAVRGLYGERSQGFGDFFQISNEVTLGRSEEKILESIKEIIPQIVEFEREVRRSLLKEDRILLEDRVWRALGMLKSARVMTSKEAMDLLSAVRMGIHLGIIEGVSIEKVNHLFLFSQPAHLQKLEGKILGEVERDVARANFIRSFLKGSVN